MFRFLSTCAFCPTPRRLGALVLQNVFSALAGAVGVGVGDSVTAIVVGVGDSAGAGVEVGDSTTAVGVALGSVVGEIGEDVAEGAIVLVEVDAAKVSIGSVAGGGVIAQPRRSIKIRIATRIIVTINLNRS
jgi:hypothetical protein